MFCKCFSAAITGIKVHLVTVEVDIRNGLPMFQMVGGVAGEVKEAKDRVKIALENSGFILPPKHITVNMSPAEIKKEGTSFDLPVAAALLAAFGYLRPVTVIFCLFSLRSIDFFCDCLARLLRPLVSMCNDFEGSKNN